MGGKENTVGDLSCRADLLVSLRLGYDHLPLTWKHVPEAIVPVDAWAFFCLCASGGTVWPAPGKRNKDGQIWRANSFGGPAGQAWRSMGAVKSTRPCQLLPLTPRNFVSCLTPVAYSCLALRRASLSSVCGDGSRRGEFTHDLTG